MEREREQPELIENKSQKRSGSLLLRSVSTSLILAGFSAIATSVGLGGVRENYELYGAGATAVGAGLLLINASVWMSSVETSHAHNDSNSNQSSSGSF